MARIGRTLATLMLPALLISACTQGPPHAYTDLANDLAKQEHVSSTDILSTTPGGLGPTHYRILVTADNDLSAEQLQVLSGKLDEVAAKHDTALSDRPSLVLRGSYLGASLALPRGDKPDQDWKSGVEAALSEVKNGIGRFEISLPKDSKTESHGPVQCVSESKVEMPYEDAVPFLESPLPAGCDYLLRIWQRGEVHPLKLEIESQKGKRINFDIRAFATLYAKYDLHAANVDQDGNIEGMGGLGNYPAATVGEIIDSWAQTLPGDGSVRTRWGTFHAQAQKITFTPLDHASNEGEKQKASEIAEVFPRPR